MASLRLLLVALCLSLCALPYAWADTKLIQDACAKAPYGDHCVDTLTSDEEAAGADLSGLAHLILQAAARKGNDTSAYISKLLDKEEDWSPQLQQCLEDCSENYMDAVEQVEDSLAALDSKAYGDAKKWVEAAVSDAESCRDGCKVGSYQDELARRNTEFLMLCSNSLAVVNLLPN